MSRKAGKLQKAAHEAHKRGKKALDEGDIPAAFTHDDKAADLAVGALFQRVRDRTAEWERQCERDGRN